MTRVADDLFVRVECDPAIKQLLVDAIDALDRGGREDLGQVVYERFAAAQDGRLFLADAGPGGAVYVRWQPFVELALREITGIGARTMPEKTRTNWVAWVLDVAGL